VKYLLGVRRFMNAIASIQDCRVAYAKLTGQAMH
jgi:hypothetical protein